MKINLSSSMSTFYFQYFTDDSNCLQKVYYIFHNLMQSQTQKMYSSQKRQKIFNVRRLPYKQFQNEKYLKYNCSPFGRKQPFQQIQNNQNNGKNMEYHFQLAIMTSPPYKELHNKFKQTKELHRREREEKLKILKQKQNQLRKYAYQRMRLENEREKLLEKRDQIKQYLQQLRQRKQAYHAEQIEKSQEYKLANMEYMKNMIISIRYQGGVDIDPDNMTYEQLLQLQQNMGKVSKGLNTEQMDKLQKLVVTKQMEHQLCSICYYNVKESEEVHKLPCRHMFHCDCIKEWLVKEKVCPMCKQEIILQNVQNN